MRRFWVLLPLIIFICIGLTGVRSQAYIQTDSTVYYWFTIPAFILGIYYTFALTNEYPKSAGGGVAFKRILITILVFAFSYRAMNGFVIYSNCHFGKQTEKLVTGRITAIKARERKLIFDKNSIDIITDDANNNLSFELPDNTYSVGDEFSKEMKMGSLGILYSPR